MSDDAVEVQQDAVPEPTMEAATEAKAEAKAPQEEQKQESVLAAARRRLSNLGKRPTQPGQGPTLTTVMDDLQHHVNLAFTWTQQKMGRADITVEPKEYLNMVENLRRSRLELTDLKEWTSQLYLANTNTCIAEQALSSSLAKLGSHTKAEKACSETVQTYVPVALEINGIRAQYAKDIKTILLDPLTSLIRNEVISASALATKVDKERLDLDTKAMRVKQNAAKSENDLGRVAAEARFEDCVKSYTKCKEDLTDLCQRIEARKNALLHQHLIDFLKAQEKYFSACREAVQSKMDGQLVVREEEE